MKFAETLKAWAALVGSMLTALSVTTGAVPDGAKVYVAIALAITTAVATWALPNAAKSGGDVE